MPDPGLVAEFERVTDAAAETFGIALADLLSRSARPIYAEPRMVAMAVLRRKGYPLQAIGDLFERDHASVWNAERTIERRVSGDAEYAEMVRLIAEGTPYQDDDLRRALDLQRRAEDLLRESRRILERLAPVEIRRTA